MITFGTLSKIVSGVIGFWSFVLLLGMVFLFALGFRRIRQNGLAEVITLLCGTALTYIMLQSILGANDNLVSHPFAIKIIREFSEIPAWVVVLICLLLTISEVFFFVKNVKWEHTHITDVSLKEAVDSLPAGVCAYEDSGRVVLKNAVMEKISNAIAKEVLLNGLLFEQSVEAYDSTDMVGRKKVLLLPDGFVYIFSKEKITFEGSNLTLLTAFDMTEEYEKIQILLQKKKSVQELNSQLVEYNRDIVSIITEQEILNAKVKIHDELGAGLLAIRHYLINGGGNKEKEEIINKLNRNIEFLQSEMAESRQDEYILMFSTANALDVRIVVDGELPEGEPNKHIIATAIHECFTNTLRHAKGDLLRIQVIDSSDDSENIGEKNVVVIFTNNGEKPSGEITEKGGLASLRSMVEGIGGAMKISTSNGFELRICLPKGD